MLTVLFYLIFLKWNWLRRTNQFNSKRPTVNCYMSTLTWITKAYTHTVSLRHALFILKVTINFHIKNTEFLDQNHTPPATDYSVHWILECILITSPWSFKLTLQKFDNFLLVRSTNKVIYNLIQNNNALTEATISQLNVTSSILQLIIYCCLITGFITNEYKFATDDKHANTPRDIISIQQTAV